MIAIKPREEYIPLSLTFRQGKYSYIDPGENSYRAGKRLEGRLDSINYTVMNNLKSRGFDEIAMSDAYTYLCAIKKRLVYKKGLVYKFEPFTNVDDQSSDIYENHLFEKVLPDIKNNFHKVMPIYLDISQASLYPNRTVPIRDDLQRKFYRIPQLSYTKMNDIIITFGSMLFYQNKMIACLCVDNYHNFIRIKHDTLMKRDTNYRNQIKLYGLYDQDCPGNIKRYIHQFLNKSLKDRSQPTSNKIGVEGLHSIMTDDLYNI